MELETFDGMGRFSQNKFGGQFDHGSEVLKVQNDLDQFFQLMDETAIRSTWISIALTADLIHIYFTEVRDSKITSDEIQKLKIEAETFNIV